MVMKNKLIPQAISFAIWKVFILDLCQRSKEQLNKTRKPLKNNEMGNENMKIKIFEGLIEIHYGF